MIRRVFDWYKGRRYVANMKSVERLNDYYWDEDDGEFFLCTEIDGDLYNLDVFEPVPVVLSAGTAGAFLLTVASIVGALRWIT